jgi:DNA-directed RNA polymerase specialized sigma24 family protein
MSASEEQIVGALPMVRRMAFRYRGTPLGAEDALGVGAVALVEAGRRFEHARGVPFAGYAFGRVKWAMQDAACGRSGARGAPPKAETPCDPDVLGDTVCDLRASRPDGSLDLFVGLGRLRSRLRTIVVQHACGVPHGCIARDLGVTESRVSQLLGIARQRLRAEAGVKLD